MNPITNNQFLAAILEEFAQRYSEFTLTFKIIKNEDDRRI